MSTCADASRIRSFIAIGLAEPARAAVVEYLERLRATVGGVAWTRVDHLHLTLKFLGDVARDGVPALVERLRGAVATVPASTLHVKGVGAFPNLARPRVLWIGIASPAVPPLAAAIETACEAEGFPREARPFRAHVTLGRIRPGKRPPDVAFLAHDGDRDFGVSPATDVVLYQSELGSGGARHTALATLPLGRPDGFS